MNYQKILLEKNEQIATITLNQPEKLNALDLEMKKELYEALEDIEMDDNILVCVLTGAGRAFCSGYDHEDPPHNISEFTNLKEEEKLFHLKKPIIAAVKGYAFGDGAQQAMLCDMIIAGEDTTIGFIGAEIGGLCYGTFTVLPALVGRQRANELLLTSKRISAQEAYRIGFVTKVVPNDQVMSTALKMAKTIAKLPPKSIRHTKKSLHIPLTNDNHLATVKEGWKDILGELELVRPNK